MAAATSASDHRPDYGLDAPCVVRNLALGSIAGLALIVLVGTGVVPRELAWRPSAGFAIQFPLLPTAIGCAIGFGIGATWMWWGSRFGKLREREELLDRLPWRGDERVLDLGCGRGLMLVAAARRVPRGEAVGVDLWQAEDLSGNTPDVPLQNAALEGVAGRVAVHTADMQKLPFPDATFDVVVSRAAIHNLYQPAQRAQAIAEVARVLKPGGRALLADIRHLPEYAATFAARGCPGARLLDSRLVAVLCAVLTMGALRPNTLLVQKPA